jgi:uroporphyrinogen-III decarboxylase
MTDYPRRLEEFQDLVRNRRRDRTMLALIVDSPWLPGYAGVSTMDFYFDATTWLRVHERLLQDLPTAVFVPGAWAELGMATEPSAWGLPIHWSDAQPPGLGKCPADLAALADTQVPDPQTQGLMPVILRRYERLRAPLRALGAAPRMAAARGPLAVASHLLGITEFLTATKLEVENCHRLLDKTTELCVAWLRAQLERMEEPIGVLVLDDLVGMMSPESTATFALPRLQRIFGEFEGLIKILHDDAPNPKVFPGLATTGMDVFNFSHTTDLSEARRLLGPDIVLMGNLPPLDLLVRGTPAQVRDATRRELDRLADVGPLLVSPGGGVSPGTPIENLQAMAAVVSERGS